MLRLQDSEPRALKRSVQRLAKEMGLSYLEDAPQGHQARAAQDVAENLRAPRGGGAFRAQALYT